MGTIIAAVLAGVGVLLAGNLVWGALLAPLNLRVLPIVPWAAATMAAYLWIYWRYIGGDIGSRDTMSWRRDQLRANAVDGDVWPMALLTGMVGFGALLSFASVLGRVVTVPVSRPLTAPSDMPALTMFILIIMGSIVAGVTEEAGFRGYMQTPIERRFGVVVATLVNGTVFGLLHFPNHPDQVLPMLPYYIAVAAVYSGITWAADSILPSLLLHVVGDVWSLTRLWITGTPEWQVSDQPTPLIWDTGVDADFTMRLAMFLAFAAGACWLCWHTAQLRTSPATAYRTR